MVFAWSTQEIPVHNLGINIDWEHSQKAIYVYHSDKEINIVVMDRSWQLGQGMGLLECS